MIFPRKMLEPEKASKMGMSYEEALQQCRDFGKKIHRQDWGSGYLRYENGQFYLITPGGKEKYHPEYFDIHSNDWYFMDYAYW